MGHLINGPTKYCNPFLIWKPIKGSKVSNADPDQTPHNVASDQGLHCLLT